MNVYISISFQEASSPYQNYVRKCREGDKFTDLTLFRNSNGELIKKTV